MRADLTDITIVMDRSGSMRKNQSDAEGGINSFVAEQRKQPGHAVLTLVKFDDLYEVSFEAMPLNDVPEIKLEPRGNTALLDAMGKIINTTGIRLSNMSEDARPGLVVFLIVTDGIENASKEFSKEFIKNLVELQQSAYNWQFTYLGANVDAFAEGAALGMSRAVTAQYEPGREREVYTAATLNVVRMRSAVASGQSAHNEYTDEERTAMGPKPTKKSSR